MAKIMFTITGSFSVDSEASREMYPQMNRDDAIMAGARKALEPLIHSASQFVIEWSPGHVDYLVARA